MDFGGISMDELNIFGKSIFSQIFSIGSINSAKQNGKGQHCVL
jgi:hypothetical protein